MGEYADYEIDRMIDEGWGGPYWRRPAGVFRPKPKRSNQQIFSQFAGPVHGTFKTGDRVVHIASGVAGTVLATRAGQISWGSDSCAELGAIWSDESALRHEGF